jgi:GNAT superfamily N-acetyltransferase
VDELGLARRGERWVLRHRLADGSATDVIGWVERIDPETVSIVTSSGAMVEVSAAAIIVARRAPAAAGGPDPLRTSAEELERHALPGLLGWSEPLGQWTLRAARGHLIRANSCLAVGDPGMPIVAAAARVAEFGAAHGIEPRAQVIAGSDIEAALRKLGWVDAYSATDVLVCRLSTFLGESLPDPDTEITETLTDTWMEAYRRSHPNDPDPAILKMILAGNPPRAFAGVAAGERNVLAIGRGHVSGPWLGLGSIWTGDDHRLEGLARRIMVALGHWGARRGARYCYLEVASGDEELRELCTKLGFIVHHRCRFLTVPTERPEVC